jgi:hypothetical protein
VGRRLCRGFACCQRRSRLVYWLIRLVSLSVLLVLKEHGRFCSKYRCRRIGWCYYRCFAGPRNKRSGSFKRYDRTSDHTCLALIYYTYFERTWCNKTSQTCISLLAKRKPIENNCFTSLVTLVHPSHKIIVEKFILYCVDTFSLFGYLRFLFVTRTRRVRKTFQINHHNTPNYASHRHQSFVLVCLKTFVFVIVVATFCDQNHHMSVYLVM